MDRRDFITICMALPLASHIEPIDGQAAYLFALYRMHHWLNSMRPDADLIRQINEIEAELGGMGYRIGVDA